MTAPTPEPDFGDAIKSLVAASKATAKAEFRARTAEAERDALRATLDRVRAETTAIEGDAINAIGSGYPITRKVGNLLHEIAANFRAILDSEPTS